MEHHVMVIVGLFILASLASASFYGWQSIIVCLLGLCVFAVVLRAFLGGS